MFQKQFYFMGERNQTHLYEIGIQNFFWNRKAKSASSKELNYERLSDRLNICKRTSSPTGRPGINGVRAE